MVNMFISGISTGPFSFVNLLGKKKTTIGNLVDIHFTCFTFLLHFVPLRPSPFCVVNKTYLSHQKTFSRSTQRIPLTKCQ